MRWKKGGAIYWTPSEGKLKVAQLVVVLLKKQQPGGSTIECPLSSHI